MKPKYWVKVMNKIERAIAASLTPDLLKGGYTGHCYVATEAYYHMAGKEQGYRAYQMKVNGVSHWWLLMGASVIDITAKQFPFKVNYWHADARCRGFLTKQPSERARIVIKRAQEKLWQNKQ